MDKNFSDYSRVAEKRILKQAPIGSSGSLLPNLRDMASYSRRGQQGNQKSDINLTDSEWSSKVYLQGVKTAAESGVVSSSGMTGYSALGEDGSDNSLFFQDLGFNSFNSSTFHDKRLKASFDESTTKGILLEKLREVHMTMQGQAERLLESESELCLLRGQLESLSAEHEGLQRDLHYLEFFKSESLKNREEFLMRVNDLEKAVTVLSTAHNALQTEAREKENVLDKTSNYVTVLERDNNKLQEEYNKIHEDHAAVKHQLFKWMKATEDAKGKMHQLNEEIAQLKMEREIVNGKVIVLEEEVQHHKRSFSNLVKEHECLLKDKFEQDQRLQKEISERLCLKMVNDLLVEESAHVKEAFQKLEQLTCVLEQKSKDFSQNFHKLEKVSENTDKEMLKQSGPSTITASQQRGSVNFLQDEVHNIKETLARLESEKTELLSQVSNLQNEQNVWLLQRSELEMTQAELVAENTQLRRDLTSKFTVQAPENNTQEINQKFEQEKEEAVKKAKEIMKKSFDEVCLELEILKSEFSKVWGKLERKGKEVEEHCRDLQQEQEQSQKLSEELMQLRKDYADLAAKTSSRSQMICTLRDELMQKCQEVIELEATLYSERQQKFTSRAGWPLKRRTLENDKSFEQKFESAEISQTEFNEMKKLTSVNTSLNERLKELMIERDLALQDSQGLLNGMQQLRDAFEEEMEQQLSRERTDLRKEKHLLQMAKSQKDDDHPSNSDSSTETRLTLLTEQKIAFEMKSKHLEYERDELRNQVEELCKMRTAAYEKAVQVDPALSPRKRENKTTLRKRSKSVGMMSTPSTTT